MKAILLLLCQTLVAGEFRLVQEAGRLVAEGVQGGVQLFTSSNLKDWVLEREFTGSTSSAISRPFARAIAKPAPPVVTIERIDATGTKATIYARTSARTISARCGTIEGQVARHEFSSKGIIGTSWKIGPFNPSYSNVTCSFTDPYGQTVSTNLTITYQGHQNPITVEYPSQGMAVVGNSIIIFGTVDRCNSTVWIEANRTSYPCAVVNGEFISPRIPIAAQNIWKVRCVNDNGSSAIDLAFTKSSVTITYQISNQTKSYGQKGICVYGGISDANYDIVIGNEVIRTTNGFWQIMIPAPKNGVIPFSVLPKQGRTSANSVGGTIECELQPFVCTYAENVSRSYMSKDSSRSVLANFAGYDRTNRLWLREKEGNRDCILEFIGFGTALEWQPSDEACGWRGPRNMYPVQSLSNYENQSSVDEMRNQSSSGCILNVGGKAGDTRKYQITLSLYLMQMTTRFFDECWFEEVVPDYGWQLGGHDNYWQFTAQSCQEIDCTATMPPFGTGWYIYDIAMTKTVIPE